MIADLKPYPEYKESGSPRLGAIPAHWNVCNLRALTTMRTERNRPDLPLLSVAREKGVFIRSLTGDDENHNVIPENLSNYKVARAGNLVINKMKAWQGSMGISPCDGIVSPAYFVFDFGITNRTFGQVLLRSRPYVAHFGQVSDGVRVGQWDLSIPGMRQIPVLIPSEVEQAAIVRFLDHANRHIDRYIRAKRKLIALLNEQKQAIIHQTVTRGLDPNVRLKSSGIPWIGEIPEHWEVVPLKSLCAIQSGVTLGKFYVGEQLTEFSYLRVANVQSGRLDLKTVKTLRLPLQEAQRSTLQVGDVLMTEGGDPDKLGRGCVWNGEVNPCLHQNHVFAVRPILTRLRPQFLAALLGSYYAKLYFLKTAKQTTNLASTNKTTISQFRVLLPNIDEQDAILHGLDVELDPVTTAIARLEREISLLREYRTRLIADVVTGKLDVRVAAANLPDETDDSETFEGDDALAEGEDSADADLDAAPEDAEA